MTNSLLRFHVYFSWFYQDRKQRLTFAIFHGLFISLFLLLFLPFGSSQNNLPNWWSLVAYFMCFGLIWALSLRAMDLIIKQRSDINLDRVNLNLVKKDFGVWMIKLILIHSIFYAFFVFTCKDCLTLADYFEIQYANFLMFLFTYIGFTLYAKNKHFKLKSEAEDSDLIIIKGQGRSDLLQIPLSQLVYIKASDNYSEIYYLKRESLAKKTLRVSMAGLEKQFATYDNISRTHRSYMVNLRYLTYQTKSYINIAVQDEQVQIPLSSTYASNLIH